MSDIEHACATLNADEPLAGTAPVAAAHVFVEHLGPWPARPMEVFDPVYAKGLGTVAASAGLVRRPGEERDATTGFPARPYVIVAANGLVAATRTDGLPDIAVLDSALSGLARGEVPQGWSAPPWLVLVCTHAHRDACCARLGRPLLEDLVAVADPSRIWETTHLGGHRFAPTCLVLPSQVVYGRVAPDRVSELADAVSADEVLPDLMRGRTTLAPALQAAEIAARQRLDVRGRLELVAHSDSGSSTTATWLADDRTVTITVVPRPGPERGLSCKGALERTQVYDVV